MASADCIYENSTGVTLTNIKNLVTYKDKFDFMADDLVVFIGNDHLLEIYSVSQLYSLSAEQTSYKMPAPRVVMLPDIFLHTVALQGCATNGNFYLATQIGKDKKIHRVSLADGSVLTDWSVTAKSNVQRMFISHSSGRVLVPNQPKKEFLEYSQDGELLRKVNVSSVLHVPQASFSAVPISAVSYVVIHYLNRNRDNANVALTWIRTSGEGQNGTDFESLRELCLTSPHERLFAHDASRALTTFEDSTDSEHKKLNENRCDNVLCLLGSGLRTYRRVRLYSSGGHSNRFYISPVRCDVERGRLLICDSGILRFFKLNPPEY